MDMLAAQVSAILYLAVVSWWSIHFKVISSSRLQMPTSKTHLLYFETLEPNHSRSGDVTTGSRYISLNGTVSVRQKAGNTLRQRCVEFTARTVELDGGEEMHNGDV